MLQIVTAYYWLDLVLDIRGPAQLLSGKYMLNTPFSPWPSFTEEEANAVRDVVLSNKVNYWTGSRDSYRQR